MKQPEGYHSGSPDTVWQLNKTLYGLKQSPKEWYDLLSAKLTEIGLEPCPSDQALWRTKSSTPTPTTPRIYVLHWVDDLLISCRDQDVLNTFKKELLTHFKGRDLGDAKSYLNIHIARDRKARTLKISQPNHIQDLLTKLGLEECKPKDVPLSTGVDLRATDAKDKPFTDGTKYAECVGALMYIMSCTRPDLAYTASSLAKHMANPCERHWTILKGVGRYLNATKDLGILYGTSPDGLTGYTDSDYAACKDTRRSRTGFVFTLYGGAVSWSSKQQSVVATSSAESEYIAASLAARECIWLRRIAHFLEVPFDKSIPLFIDNQSALHMATNSSDSARTKHIDVHYHFLRNVVNRHLLRMSFISTDDNPSDMFTKALSRDKFSKFAKLIGAS